MPPHLPKETARDGILDWLKAWAILAVLMDHLKVIAEPYVVWSVNVFVMVTASMYGRPGYEFPFSKLVSRLAYLFFIYAAAILFFYFMEGFGAGTQSHSLFSVIFNPYRAFIANPYLGHIWYLALHVQILIFLFFYLKIRPQPGPGKGMTAALLLASVSFLVTHFFIRRFNTILITSWFFYLALGFYGLRPFLERVERGGARRGLRLAAAFFALILIYSVEFYFMPWSFTNEDRTTFLMLPVYFALIFFLAELFYFLKQFSQARLWVDGMNAAGRATLAIYLTHDAFADLWRAHVSSPWLLALLSLGCGFLFGAAADRLFAGLKSGLERFPLRRLQPRTS